LLNQPSPDMTERFLLSTPTTLWRQCLTSARSVGQWMAPHEGAHSGHSRQLMDRVKEHLYHMENTRDTILSDGMIGAARWILRKGAEIGSSADDRKTGCSLLAQALRLRFALRTDESLLDEIIALNREALSLCPSGDQDRGKICSHLADALMERYKLTGDVRVLNEAVDLHRESHDLSACWLSCLNMAIAMRARYVRTGDVRLLDEAIELTFNACSGEHSHCSIQFADILKARYQHTGDTYLLDEVISLERKALRLCPAGHNLRSLICGNLACSLSMSFKVTGEVFLLDESIRLRREMMALCAAENPLRSKACGGLADSLIMQYNRFGNEALLHEIFSLLQEAVTLTPVHTVWRCLNCLAWLHIQVNSPFYNVGQAISLLSQSLQNQPDYELVLIVPAVRERLDEIWGCDHEGNHLKLMITYQRLVNLLPLLAHPTLGVRPQLQALRQCTSIGSDAFINAALAGNWSSGFETLELARGVIWSQSLHRRDPLLKDVPEPLASNLQQLLQAMAMGSAAKSHSETTARTRNDMLHIQSSQLDEYVRAIRELPGLDRFMLGETFETLRAVAFNHPVVVLVSARGHYYALIFAISLVHGHALLPLNINDEDILNASLAIGTTRSCRSADFFFFF
jgi:hypothetical protein